MDLTVGQIIRHCRQTRGLSARQLSLTSGLSESVVGKVESGTIEPSLRVFALIATELDLTAQEISFLVRIEAGRHPRPSI